VSPTNSRDPEAGTGEDESGHLSLDERLIAALQANGRLTNMALSRQFGVSEALVRQRLKRLFDAQAIRACAIADIRAMGLANIAMVRACVRPAAIERIQASLCRISNVTSLYLISGSYNILMWCVSRNPEELSEFLDTHLRRDKDVSRIDVNTVISAYRYQGLSGFIVDEE
jgi:Lrp/AsnC family transcriptional regulator for asnA, asnC and gidA